MSQNRIIKVLPAARSLRVMDASGTRVVKVPQRVVKVVEVGRLVVNTSGGAAFTHEQLTPSASWIFNHPLGRLPAVSLYLLDGESIETDVFVTTTQVNITFPTPIAGRALLN